jgi:hypothetical protein
MTSARNVDGNGEVSLPNLTILALYRGKHHLQSLTHTLKITFDITKKQVESTLNSLSAHFSTWFVKIQITSDLTSEKRKRLCWAVMQKVSQHTWINSARKICPSNRAHPMQTGKRRTKTVLNQFRAPYTLPETQNREVTFGFK